MNAKAVQGTLSRAQFYQSLAASRLTAFVYCICVAADIADVLYCRQVADGSWKLAWRVARHEKIFDAKHS